MPKKIYNLKEPPTVEDALICLSIFFSDFLILKIFPMMPRRDESGIAFVDRK